MLKSIGGVFVGVLAGALIIFAVEGLGHMIFPPPAGTNLKDPAALAAIMDTIPLGAKLAVVVAWFAGIFGGGIAGLYVGGKWAPVAWVIAAALLGMAVISMMQIPHPSWMIAGAAAATLLGSYGAIKLTGANYQRPVAKSPTPGL